MGALAQAGGLWGAGVGEEGGGWGGRDADWLDGTRARGGAGWGEGWERDLAQGVSAPRREVVHFEEGLHDVGPLLAGVHACDVDGVEASAVLEVHDASILELSRQVPEPSGNREQALKRGSKVCEHGMGMVTSGGFRPSLEHS